MDATLEKYLLPPSPLYPIAGLALGYFLSEGEKKPFVMIAGALAGIAINVATRSIQFQVERAQANGATEFHSSLGKELLAAAVGSKEAEQPAQVASGPFSAATMRGVVPAFQRGALAQWNPLTAQWRRNNPG